MKRLKFILINDLTVGFLYIIYALACVNLKFIGLLTQNILETT